MNLSSPEFWIALMQIIGVNIVLSGDNAVVIALAARGLPATQQKKAIAWGSAAAVVMIGEIGGSAEEEAAEFVKSNMDKPVAAFIAGQNAPPGKRMGHAGALISGGADTAEAKLAIMEECGFKVTRNPSEMGRLLKSLL